MTDVNAYAKGVMGETAAFQYLCQRGMEPLARRFRSPFGELDLVMLHGDALVFVEVKARERGGAEAALLAVDERKRRRLIEAARCYVGEHPEHANRVMRFDVVAVSREGISHVENAFGGWEW